ncbi:MAG: hypothetical protein P8015_13845, partial [Acidihalobacter sp.]
MIAHLVRADGAEFPAVGQRGIGLLVLIAAFQGEPVGARIAQRYLVFEAGLRLHRRKLAGEGVAVAGAV